jgi:DNA-binding GntR family transcriptional regulator
MPTAQLDPDDVALDPHSSLADALFERLSEAIVQGEFAPGVKLSEPRLAARFGVSRGSLREAIRRLEERKLVTRTLRQGVRVIVPSRTAAIELF